MQGYTFYQGTQYGQTPGAMSQGQIMNPQGQSQSFNPSASGMTPLQGGGLAYTAPAAQTSDQTYRSTGNAWWNGMLGGKGINNAYVHNNEIGGTGVDISKDNYLSQLNDSQISSINRSMGGHAIGDVWGNGVNMNYGHDGGYLGEYAKIGSQTLHPDQYQSVIDAYNKFQQGLPLADKNGNPTQFASMFGQASNLQDVYNNVYNNSNYLSTHMGSDPFVQQYLGNMSPTQTARIGGLRV